MRAFPVQQLLVQAELLVEAADTAASVHDLLLAGKKGVALGTNFHSDVALGGAGLNDIATGAPDGGLIILGVDAFLHGISPLSQPEHWNLIYLKNITHSNGKPRPDGVSQLLNTGSHISTTVILAYSPQKCNCFLSSF